MAQFFQTATGFVNRDLVCEVLTVRRGGQLENRFLFASGTDSSRDMHITKHPSAEAADRELYIFVHGEPPPKQLEPYIKRNPGDPE